ncbi:MAG: aerobic carbon-monoxide dehydrogenase medium subunit [bacterium]
MKAAPFAYERPASFDEALELLSTPGAKALAGGQSLVPMMAMRLVRPSVLVDLSRVPGLDELRDEGSHVHVGAMTRQRALERWAPLAGRVPLAAAALPSVGHRETRNRGTVGGSLVHADPAAELSLVAATLEAELVVRGARGERTIPGAEFAVGPFQTQVAEDELLTAVRLPAARAGEGFAFEEIARRHGDFALCGVAVSLRRRGDAVARARVGLLGVGPAPQVHDVTDLLEGDGAATRWASAGDALAERIEPSGDMHASAGYRRRLARVLVTRNLQRAWDDAGRRTA